MAFKLATAALQHSLLQQDGTSTTLGVIVAHGFPQGNCSGLVLEHGLEYLTQCRYMVDVRMHILWMLCGAMKAGQLDLRQ